MAPRRSVRDRKHVNYAVPNEDDIFEEPKQHTQQPSKQPRKMDRKSKFDPEAAARINELLKPKWDAEALERVEWERKKAEQLTVNQREEEEAYEADFQKRVESVVKAERMKSKQSMERLMEKLGPVNGVECLRKFWEGGNADPLIKSYKMIYKIKGGPRCMKVIEVPQPDWKLVEPDNIPPVLIRNPIAKEWSELTNDMKITIANQWKLTRRSEEKHACFISEMGLSGDDYYELCTLWPADVQKVTSETDLTQDYHTHFTNPRDKVNDWNDRMASAFSKLSLEQVPMTLYLTQDEIEDGRGFLYSRGKDYTFLGACVGMKIVMTNPPATRVFGGTPQPRGHIRGAGSEDHDYDAQRLADKFRHEKKQLKPATAKLFAENENNAKLLDDENKDEESDDEGLNIAQLKARIDEGEKKLMQFGPGHEEQNVSVREQNIYDAEDSDIDMDRDENTASPHPEHSHQIYDDEHDPRSATVGQEPHVFVSNPHMYRDQIDVAPGHEPSAAATNKAVTSTRQTRRATPTTDTYTYTASCAAARYTSPKPKLITVPRKFLKPAAAAQDTSPKPATTRKFLKPAAAARGTPPKLATSKAAAAQGTPPKPPTPKAAISAFKLNQRRLQENPDDDYVEDEKDDEEDDDFVHDKNGQVILVFDDDEYPPASAKKNKVSGQTSSPASATKKNKAFGQSSSPATPTKKNKASGQSFSPASATKKNKGKRVIRD